MLCSYDHGIEAMEPMVTKTLHYVFDPLVRLVLRCRRSGGGSAQSA